VNADTLHYRLVYDAAAAGYTDWWFPAAGVVMLFVWCGGLYHKRHEGPRFLLAFLAVIGVPFIAFWIFGTATDTYGAYAGMRDALRDRRYVRVEGTVENFHPGDVDGHEEESWTVKSGGHVHRYAYAHTRLTPGFRKVAARGGPIRPGLRVRIAEVDGYIARLEVAR